MNFKEYSPIRIGIHQVPSSVRDSVRSKVNEYLNSSDCALQSPSIEVVKTTYHTDTNILDTLQLTELTEEIKSCAIKHLDMLGDSTDEFFIVSWLNVFEKNSLELDHEHYGSVLSGCYYVDSGGLDDSGCFSIPDQIRAREFYRRSNNLEIRDHHRIPPLPGRLLTFEPWMTHGVFANKTDKPRISLAFNIERGTCL